MTLFKQGSWNLTELVTDPKSAAFRKQLKEIETKLRNFEKMRNYLKPNISTQKFAHILSSLEEISEKFSKVGGYASLEYSADTQSDEATSLLTRMTKLGSQIENRTLYFDQWWKKQLDQKNANRLIKSSGELSEFLRFKRLLARYSLSE
ncbi:MAG TPA: oligoendopeptidase F, partial [Nitrosopumilaceae archaeon]|nr:oligoendopeptidase F [Nitrosopumilaceae archaeon]